MVEEGLANMNSPIKNLDLNSLRQKIDVIDSQLVKLLNDRASVSLWLWMLVGIDHDVQVSVNIGLAKRKNLPDPYYLK